MSRGVRDDIETLRAREKATERDTSFAAHCEGYGLEWLDEPEEGKKP